MPRDKFGTPGRCLGVQCCGVCEAVGVTDMHHHGYLNKIMKCESLSNRRPQRQWSTREGVHKLSPLASCQRQKMRVKMREKAPVKVMLVPCACNPAMLGASTEPLHPLCAHTHCTLLPYLPHAPMLKIQSIPRYFSATVTLSLKCWDMPFAEPTDEQ